MNISRALEQKRREFSFDGNALKIIAMVSMLIDHIGVVLIQNGKLWGYELVLYQNVIALPEGQHWLRIYRICRMIGRLAFPIFALLLVEGFRKSSNLFKYMMRILIFAIISEIPFDLAIYNKLICYKTQNVLFTYFVALLMLLVIKQTRDFPVVVHGILAIIAGGICYFAKTDYAIEGTLLIFVMYIFRHDLNAKCIIVALTCFIFSFQNNFGFGILATYFIYFYSERRGLLELKRLPYIFFPVHLLVLYSIVFFSNLH